MRRSGDPSQGAATGQRSSATDLPKAHPGNSAIRTEGGSGGKARGPPPGSTLIRRGTTPANHSRAAAAAGAPHREGAEAAGGMEEEDEDAIALHAVRSVGSRAERMQARQAAAQVVGRPTRARAAQAVAAIVAAVGGSGGDQGGSSSDGDVVLAGGEDDGSSNSSGGDGLEEWGSAGEGGGRKVGARLAASGRPLAATGTADIAAPRQVVGMGPQGSALTNPANVAASLGRPGVRLRLRLPARGPNHMLQQQSQPQLQQSPQPPQPQKQAVKVAQMQVLQPPAASIAVGVKRPAAQPMTVRMPDPKQPACGQPLASVAGRGKGQHGPAQPQQPQQHLNQLPVLPSACSPLAAGPFGRWGEPAGATTPAHGTPNRTASQAAPGETQPEGPRHVGPTTVGRGTAAPITSPCSPMGGGEAPELTTPPAGLGSMQRRRAGHPRRGLQLGSGGGGPTPAARQLAGAAQTQQAQVQAGGRAQSLPVPPPDKAKERPWGDLPPIRPTCPLSRLVSSPVSSPRLGCKPPIQPPTAPPSKFQYNRLGPSATCAPVGASSRLAAQPTQQQRQAGAPLPHLAGANPRPPLAAGQATSVERAPAASQSAAVNTTSHAAAAAAVMQPQDSGSVQAPTSGPRPAQQAAGPGVATYLMPGLDQAPAERGPDMPGPALSTATAAATAAKASLAANPMATPPGSGAASTCGPAEVPAGDQAAGAVGQHPGPVQMVVGAPRQPQPALQSLSASGLSAPGPPTTPARPCHQTALGAAALQAAHQGSGSSGVGLAPPTPAGCLLQSRAAAAACSGDGEGCAPQPPPAPGQLCGVDVPQMWRLAAAHASATGLPLGVAWREAQRVVLPHALQGLVKTVRAMEPPPANLEKLSAGVSYVIPSESQQRGTEGLPALPHLVIRPPGLREVGGSAVQAMLDMVQSKAVLASVLPLKDENLMKTYLLRPCQRAALLAQHGGRLHLAPGTSALEPLLQDRSFLCLHYVLDDQGQLHTCCADVAPGTQQGQPCSGGPHRYGIADSNLQVGLMVRKGVGGTCPLRAAARQLSAAGLLPALLSDPPSPNTARLPEPALTPARALGTPGARAGVACPSPVATTTVAASAPLPTPVVGQHQPGQLVPLPSAVQAPAGSGFHPPAACPAGGMAPTPVPSSARVGPQAVAPLIPGTTPVGPGPSYSDASSIKEVVGALLECLVGALEEQQAGGAGGEQQHRQAGPAAGDTSIMEADAGAGRGTGTLQPVGSTAGAAGDSDACLAAPTSANLASAMDVDVAALDGEDGVEELLQEMEEGAGVKGAPDSSTSPAVPAPAQASWAPLPQWSGNAMLPDQGAVPPTAPGLLHLCLGGMATQRLSTYTLSSRLELYVAEERWERLNSAGRSMLHSLVRALERSLLGQLAAINLRRLQYFCTQLQAAVCSRACESPLGRSMAGMASGRNLEPEPPPQGPRDGGEGCGASCPPWGGGRTKPIAVTSYQAGHAPGQGGANCSAACPRLCDRLIARLEVVSEGASGASPPHVRLSLQPESCQGMAAAAAVVGGGQMSLTAPVSSSRAAATSDAQQHQAAPALAQPLEQQLAHGPASPPTVKAEPGQVQEEAAKQELVFAQPSQATQMQPALPSYVLPAASGAIHALSGTAAAATMASAAGIRLATGSSPVQPQVAGNAAAMSVASRPPVAALGPHVVLVPVLAQAPGAPPGQVRPVLVPMPRSLVPPQLLAALDAAAHAQGAPAAAAVGPQVGPAPAPALSRSSSSIVGSPSTGPRPQAGVRPGPGGLPQVAASAAARLVAIPPPAGVGPASSGLPGAGHAPCGGPALLFHATPAAAASATSYSAALVLAAACLAAAEALGMARGFQIPWPYYLINTRDCFTHHLVPLSTTVTRDGRQYIKTQFYFRKGEVPENYHACAPPALVQSGAVRPLPPAQAQPQAPPLKPGEQQQHRSPAAAATIAGPPTPDKQVEGHSRIGTDASCPAAARGDLCELQTVECCAASSGPASPSQRPAQTAEAGEGPAATADPGPPRTDGCPATSEAQDAVGLGLLPVGMTTYSEVFTDAELREVERWSDVVDTKARGGLLPDTCFHSSYAKGGGLKRTKFFFGARYMWTREQLAEADARVAAGVRVDVPATPSWMKEYVEDPLVAAHIIPKAFVDSFALNMYHDGSEGLQSHFDDADRFARPIYSLRLFSDSRLSFGMSLYGYTNGLFCVPLPRGCVAVMEEGSYAANAVKHCVRPMDMQGKSAGMILRRIHPPCRAEAERHYMEETCRWMAALSLNNSIRLRTSQQQQQAHDRRGPGRPPGTEPRLRKVGEGIKKEVARLVERLVARLEGEERRLQADAATAELVLLSAVTKVEAAERLGIDLSHCGASDCFSLLDDIVSWVENPLPPALGQTHRVGGLSGSKKRALGGGAVGDDAHEVSKVLGRMLRQLEGEERATQLQVQQVVSALVHATEQTAAWEAGGGQGSHPTYATSSALFASLPKKAAKPHKGKGGTGSGGIGPHHVLPLATQLVGRVLVGAGSGSWGKGDVLVLLLQHLGLPSEAALRQLLLTSVRHGAPAVSAAAATGGAAPLTVLQYQAAVSLVAGMLCQLNAASSPSGSPAAKVAKLTAGSTPSGSGGGQRRAAVAEAGGDPALSKPAKKRQRMSGDGSGERVSAVSVNKALPLICFGCHEGVQQEDAGSMWTCQGPCRRTFHPGCRSPAGSTCHECATHSHTCFACGQPGGGVSKCSMGQCSRHYHWDCVASNPLAKLAASGRSNFKCPLHYCTSCGLSGDGIPMVQCITCPRGYHIRCRPAASKILSKKFIVCPSCTEKSG